MTDPPGALNAMVESFTLDPRAGVEGEEVDATKPSQRAPAAIDPPPGTTEAVMRMFAGGSR